MPAIVKLHASLLTKLLIILFLHTYTFGSSYAIDDCELCCYRKLTIINVESNMNRRFIIQVTGKYNNS